MFSALRRSVKLVRLGAFVRVSCPPPRSFFCTESAAQGPSIEALTNGDKELEHKLKVLILEVDVMRQEGKLVPDDDFLKDKHWKELLELPTYSARKRFLEYLFKISKKKENRLIKKEEKKQFRGSKPEKNENETLEEFVSTYDLSHNNIFLRVYETTINQLYNNRLVQAMQFGQKLVVDCGYDQDMTVRENKNCAKQLTLLFAENRAHDDPFDLHYCNLNTDSVLHKTLENNIATLHEPWFPLNVHETSYLEKFPKEQLVYLTPHCREELVEYDHDAIYIIGAIVDKVNTQPLSLAKAKREGLKMAKFPLDRYLQWGGGSGKSLTLNQCVSILLDVKLTGDWKYALRHVPKRKIMQIAEQKTLKSKFWKPGKKVDLSNLSHKNKDRRIEIRSIMYDEN
ncbi:mitochondrial ribonuclease P protein 1 homolog [Tribolium madens]|uniref:mitochondrial ribonuclease P protein 1 homolog n=1 Tax=Tribolium madens TaxID=41895 RepID=UPI001CF72787|nr:mitochondrial ribonuclease P protein 1 homolog [Tribolium madens]